MDHRYASGITDLLRENMALRAEVEALTGILQARELTGRIASDWRDVLSTVRKTESYLATVHRYDDLIQRVSEAGERADVDRMLESVELHRPLA